MASGKKNYFRHSFSARNDEFIVGLMKEFKEKGYYMWFALCEISGEKLSDGHQWPLKFNQSTLYKELRCNHSKLNMFFTYVEHKCKISVTYVEPIFTLEIPSLSKYLGKYSENAPNKRKEKEIKEKENKVINNGEKNLPEIKPEDFRNSKDQTFLKKPSPLSFLFGSNPDIQTWLNDGLHETHMMLLKKYSHHELVDLIEQAFAWAAPRGTKAESWLYTFVSNKNTAGYGLNQGKAAFKNKTNTVTATPKNPTANPYIQEAIDKGLIA